MGINSKTNGFKLLLMLCVVFVSFTEPMIASLKAASVPKISVIIDDVGDSQELGLRAARLPPQVALSILPHTPFSHEIAVIGHQRGMDILLHQPMESLENIDLLGPGALLASMGREEFSRILENNLNAIPFVVGINNHMGSLLTTDYEKMNWLMAELKPRAIFFIDSRTTTETVAAFAAERWQIPSMSRKVFLDHDDRPQAIAEQYQRLLRLAEKYGHATAIGHPRTNTLKFLEQKLAESDKAGFKLVSPSEAMQSLYTPQFVKIQEQDVIKPVHFYDNCYQRTIKKRFNTQLLHTLDSHLNCSGY